ncbi:hypothetical protein CFE70_006125 [Pyrenophora teres f. teres 0-1]
MPFRDKEWEDFQRSCDFFPAYSDYLYGPDERLVVTQEPGLHPQMYPALTFAPTQYTNSMPSRSYNTSEHYHVQDSAASRRQSLRRQTPGHETFSGASSARNSPGLDMRSEMGSPVGAFKRQQGAHKIPQKATKKRKLSSAPRNAARPQPVNDTYPTMQPHLSLQLRQNINRHLPKVWKCLQIAQDTTVSADDMEAQKEKMQANEWLMMFKRSLPPDGHYYMVQVVCHMISENKAGRWPLAFLGSGNMEQQGQGWCG